MNPAELREALERHDELNRLLDEVAEETDDPECAAPPDSVLVNAARAYLRILEEGERVQWCEEHNLPTTGAVSCWQATYGCRMVSRILTPEED